MILTAQGIVPWTDAMGGRASTFWGLQARPDLVPAAVISVANAARALSAAGTDATMFQCVHPVSSGTGASPYLSVQDLVRFTWQTTAGTRVVTSIPAPIAAIFTVDTWTVDQSNGLVVAFVAAARATLADAGGNAVTTLVSASRGRVDR